MFKQTIVGQKPAPPVRTGLRLGVLLLLSGCLQNVCAKTNPASTNGSPLLQTQKQQPVQPETIEQATVVTAASASQNTPPPGILKLAAPVEREIEGGQSHPYQIDLAAGQYMKVRIDQRGIDVVLRV